MKARATMAAIAAAALSAGTIAAAPAASAAPAALTAQSREVYVSMPGAAGPGPARYDTVHVLEVGAAAARQVLVLAPGLFGAAGGLAPLAREAGWFRTPGSPPPSTPAMTR